MKLETEPKARIFVCVNEKAPEKGQCLKGEGEKCVTWLRGEIKNLGLADQIWVSRTKCQDYCTPQGTVVTFEPTHQQYSEVRVEELPKLLEGFIENLKATSLIS